MVRRRVDGLVKHTLRIDGWHPTLLNAMLWKHWRVVSKLKKTDETRIVVECRNQRIPNATGKRRVILTWVMASRSKPIDADAPWKNLLDGLVTAGALKDDNLQWCELVGPVLERGPVKGIRVELEDI